MKHNLSYNSIVSRRSLSLKRSNNNNSVKNLNEVDFQDKENLGNVISTQPKIVSQDKASESNSIKSLDIAYISQNNETESIPFSFEAVDLKDCDKHTVLSNTELNATPSESSEGTLINNYEERPVISLSFSVNDCDKIDISSYKSNIMKVSVEHKEAKLNVDCEIVEGSYVSEVTDENTLMNEISNGPKSPQKRRSDTTVNLEIKKQKLTTGEQSTEKILILKTNAIEKLSHVIVQPPNYKLVKRKIHDKSKSENDNRKFVVRSEIISVTSCHLKQKSIDTYFRSATRNDLKTKQLDESAVELLSGNDWNVCKVQRIGRNDVQEMNKSLGVVDAKYDGRILYKSSRNESAKTTRQPQRTVSPKAALKASLSDVPRKISPRSKKDSAGSFSPRRPVESLQFNLPIKSKSNRSSIAPRSNIPYHKIVAGTHFAVDAFSYGEIPNVKHYFLTHFHSDHYSGLKKSFNKLLFCSKITADLCISRLGVNPKCIQVINIDETIRVEGVEIAVVDANHCPGAVMLIFTLPNGKSLLHTGDFRAAPIMESFPVFWNKDMHTIYLDTTYCNPRYDFPTQDHSLEMALYILRQKKMELEKVGKNFSSVLIVCGTYTIGKEKFFLGMARRVGCSVWACPEKDRVLQAVEGRSFSRTSPQACQLHVVPMRDLTHEKLRSYLDSMQGTFKEVVAFKPSGWENGKNSSVEKDSVTIHGIPYSEHSSFSELIRFVKFLKPKQIVPTVDISGGIKTVQKYFPCPMVSKDSIQCQSKLTDFFSIQSRKPAAAVT
ncbi:uncharacterized protein [Maniola hyperantus]|uniref:uncharacterized protein isoform X2 n=1 Tax=Aphantopus hyperantus TaxID=2795564 RepID=UPI00374A4E42